MTDLMRWNPLRDMEQLLDRFGGSAVRRPVRTDGTSQEAMTLADWIPTVDILENDNEFQIKMELPEVRKEDVNVAINQGVLTIQGERHAQREDKNEKYHRVERSYGTFARTFSLPDNVKEDGIRARFKDGMLYLQIEKSERAKPRSIDVKID